MEGVKDCLKTKPVRLVLAKDNLLDGNERGSEAASTGFLPPGEETLQCRSIGILPEMKSLMADPQCLENPTCDSNSEMREVPKARTTLPLDL